MSVASEYRHVDEIARLRAENERLRGDVKIIETSFTEVCDALGCAYDNEAALIAADSLRAENERLLKLLARATIALSPFDAFADRAAAFVDSAARGASGLPSPALDGDRGTRSGVMPTNHFRLNDFLRAREISAEIEAALLPALDGDRGGELRAEEK